MVVSKRNLEVNLIESGVASVMFVGLEAEPSRLNRARMADNHVEQNNPILFACNTIGRASEHFITVLTDWIDDTHGSATSKQHAFIHHAFCRSETAECRSFGTNRGQSVSYPIQGTAVSIYCRVVETDVVDHLQNSRRPNL